MSRYIAFLRAINVATFLRTPAELAAIAWHEPFAAADRGAPDHGLYVAFLPDRLAAAAQGNLMSCRSDIDDFAVREREVYWLCRNKLSESRFSGAALERTLQTRATLRNITTVRKLAAKYCAAE